MTNLIGKTITWTWTEGAFKGGKYEVILHNDGKIHWKGLEGVEKDQEAMDKEYKVIKAGENIYTLSWLESIGWTVTVTLNIEENKAYGFVSNHKEWYPLSGVIESIK